MQNLRSPKTLTCKELLNEYSLKTHPSKGEKLIFAGVGDRDVYNITAPFEDEGEMVIAGRVEGRDTEYSEIKFFTCKDGVWSPRENTTSLKLQDPFYTRIAGQLILGGVQVKADKDNPERLIWRTQFYKGENINELKLLATGPIGMKDIRLIELADGKVGLFTRPQGVIGGRGQIGFTILDNLDQLNENVMSNAQLIQGQFIPEEWGGSNEPHLLKNNKIGVLGHIACYDEENNRHYYSVTFSLNPDTREVSPLKMIATRRDFPMGEAKKPDLQDVIFSGGIVRNWDGTATLYVGAGDVEAHRLVISDPFIEYE